MSETKASNYSVPLTLPSGKKLRLTELKNRDYFTIVKFCENEDFKGFTSIIECLIPEFSALNVVDKAYILIAYRALFVHADTQVNNTEGRPVTIPVFTILDKLEKLGSSEKIITVSDFEICISAFDNYDYEDPGSVFDCIKWIKLGSVTVSEGDVKEVVNNLPSKVFNHINKEVLRLYNTYTDVELISENIAFDLPAMHSSLVDGSFGKFILSLYTVPLNNFFELIFIYSQRMGNVDFFNLSPLDSRVLENILQREVARNTEQGNQQPIHTNPLTPHL